MSLHFVKALPAFVAGFLLSACATDLPMDADTFTPEGLVSGSRTTKENCTYEDTSVWVEVGGRGECIRYFHIGLDTEDANPRAVLWFHGDRLQRVWDSSFRTVRYEILGYDNNSPEAVVGDNEFWQSEAGIPFIQVARPGTYGSSGDHKVRRQQREIDVILAAVEAIKEKHGIEKLYIAGQAGGAHSAAAVITNRNDVECGVMSAGFLAVKMRNEMRGWPGDATGYNYFYDPIAHVEEIPESATRRLFIVGDRRDLQVPFASQEAYYEAVKAAGHAIWLVEGEGRGPSFNLMSRLSRRMIAACARDLSTEEVIERAGD